MKSQRIGQEGQLFRGTVASAADRGTNECDVDGRFGREMRQVSERKKLWRGLQPLSKAFWGYYVVGGIVVFVIFSAIGGLVIYAAASTFPVVRPIVYIIGCLIIWAYWVMSSVGVWRSANATKAGSLRKTPRSWLRYLPLPKSSC